MGFYDPDMNGQQAKTFKISYWAIHVERTMVEFTERMNTIYNEHMGEELRGSLWDGREDSGPEAEYPRIGTGRSQRSPNTALPQSQILGQFSRVARLASTPCGL